MPVNANELFNHLDFALAARDAGAKGDGIVRSRLIGGIEFGQAQEASERKLRAAFKRRLDGGPTPLVLIADHAGADGLLDFLGPESDGPLRTVPATDLRDLIESIARMGDLAGVRHFARGIERLNIGRAEKG